MRILIVEDSSTAAYETRAKLRNYGFDVLATRTLEQIGGLSREPGLDAILLDLSQPDCSGMDLLHELRRLAGDLPIVVYSVHNDQALALEFVRRGAQDYLIKGIASADSLGRCLEYAIERNRVEHAQRVTEMRMKVVLEHSYDAFITMDSHWRITEWNIPAERTFGWKREEVLGQSLSCIIPHHLRKHFLNSINSYFVTAEGNFLKTSTAIVAQHRSGRTFPAEFGIFRIDRGVEFLFCAFVRDMTELKKSNEELERLVHERTEKLIQSNEELRQFAKVASHDLQEPLRAVQGFANLLAEATEGKLDKDCSEFIDFIIDGVHRMKQLIQSILIHSQMTSAAQINEDTNCNSVIDEVLTDLRPMIDETQTSLEIDVLPRVAVERSQMVQLFQNLISNSIKYRGAGAPSIAIAAERSIDQWLFSVRDNGIGIEPQYADKVFDMFSRLHSKGRYPGTGIGLAICKRIVTSHGGNIWVESNPGQGCIFMFTLPAVTEGRKTKMADAIHILLVEDTPSDVRLTQEALKRSGLEYKLTVAADGVEAMEYLNDLKKSAGREMPGIILLDLNMPRKNGHEVLEEIMRDPALRPIPVVLLTVSERDEDVLQALNSKMNYYVAKPVTAQTLSTLIKAIHDLHREGQSGAARTEEETHIRAVLAGNPHTPIIALARLADDPHLRVRCRLAENARLPEDLQIKLANDPQPEVRISLCENASLETSVLELLVKDESEDVRLAVSTSPGITAELLRDLARDENVYVSASANKSLAAIG